MSVRRQLSWINTALPTTANKYAGWDVSGNPAVKNLTTAVANELPKSTGADALTPSGIFALPSNGNLQLGSASISGDRTIENISSSVASSLNIVTKGTSSIVLETNNVLLIKSGSNSQFAVYNSAGSESSFWNYQQLSGSQTIFSVIGRNNTGAGNGGELVVAGGSSANDDGGGLTLQGGGAPLGNAGNILIQSGIGSAIDGDITIDTLTGNLFLDIPTSSAGLPSGASYWNANVLTRVP